MLQGETILSGADPNCPDCFKHLEFEILQSGAGYYVGTQCHCGPYSRESIYLETEDKARLALISIRGYGALSKYART